MPRLTPGRPLNVPKTMTLGALKRHAPVKKSITRGTGSKPQPATAKKPVASKPKSKALPPREKQAASVGNRFMGKAVEPPSRSLLAKRRKEQEWQKRERIRQDKAIERRAKKIANGFLHKGRWIVPEVRRPFIFKVEAGSEGSQESPIVIEDENTMAHVPALTDSVISNPTTYASTFEQPLACTQDKNGGTHHNMRNRNIGPDITTSFDRRYPQIAEMVENSILDEQDDAGSLCDFVVQDMEDEEPNWI